MAFHLDGFRRLYVHYRDRRLFKHLARALPRAVQKPPAPLLRAIERTAAFEMTSEEVETIARIERLRVILSADQSRVQIIDYGAGRPDARRTQAEMTAGRIEYTTVAQVARASRPPLWALFLHHLIRELRPSRCLELGTCVGVSAAYQAAALALNGEGHLVTLEGAPALAGKAQKILADLGLERATVIQGRFLDTLDGVLQNNGPFDYCFIDGHHDEAATLEYFNQVYPHMQPGGVFVLDDISWSPGMRRAWQTIRSDTRVRYSADLTMNGFCVV